MTRKVPGLLALAFLVSVSLLHAGFYTIDALDTPSEYPVLTAKLSVDADTQSQDTYVRAYLYDRNGKLTHSLTNPPSDLPLMFTKGNPVQVYFRLPPEVKRGDCNAVVVFGDSDQAEALGYPDKNLTVSCDYPEKKLVNASFGKFIDRKAAIPPYEEYTVNPGSQDISRPQVTLFLRMPKGVSDPKQLKGVLVVCVLWQLRDQARSDMQKPEMDGDYHGLFAYANEHKLAIIAWGGPGITSRPMMLSGVARQTQHAGQKKLSITLNHGKSVEIKEMVAAASSFLKNVIDAAEQLAQPERWRLILSRIFVNFLDGRILCGGPQAVMSG